jgi:hypothetical protein
VILLESGRQHRSLKRACDLRDQLAGLMACVDIDLVSGAGDTVGIRKVTHSEI